MSKNPKNIIRVNDRIKIVTPNIFERCGYPLSKKMIKDEITSEQKKSVFDMLGTFGISVYNANIEKLLLDDNKNGILYEKIVDIVAGGILRQRGWGGKLRSIHHKYVPELKDTKCMVISKRIVKTGTYNHGYSNLDYWGEYSCEPPYLSNEKSHVILMVNINGSDFINDSHDFIEIEACNVEKIDFKITCESWE